ncbi:MAG: FxsA family protein [Phycisphaerales bacterium]|nr:FxsA family protein [Phycisphaerales bacterium]
MLFRLFILFTIIPLIELSILIKIGAYIGTWNTIVLVVTTGMLGAALARHQGIKTFTSIQQALQAGQLPGDRLIDALLILIAGALLITPGILTDVAGFLLLIGSTRGAVRRYLKNRFQAHLVVGRCPPVDYRRDDDFIDVEATASDTENPPDQE